MSHNPDSPSHKDPAFCGQCGRVLPPDGVPGFCPRCELSLALEGPVEADTPVRSDPAGYEVTDAGGRGSEALYHSEAKHIPLAELQ